MLAKYVDGHPGHGDNNNDGSLPHPWATIQHGVDELARRPQPGPPYVLNLISAPPGGYQENVRMIGAQYSDITIGACDQWGNPLTINQPATEYYWDAFCEGRPPVNGTQKGPVFEIQDATGVLLQDLNIYNGKAHAGAGVLAIDAQVDLIRCCIHDNEATAPAPRGVGPRFNEGGGGFYFVECNRPVIPAIPNSIVAGWSRTSTIDTCVIYNNKARTEGGGGLVRANQGPITIKHTLVHHNEAAENGGGFAFEQCADITIHEHCVFGALPNPPNPASLATSYSNTAKNGGAIYISECGTLLIGSPTVSADKEKNWIDRNEATESGGGIRILSGRVSVVVGGTNIRKNRADGPPGVDSKGGGIAIQQFDAADRPKLTDVHDARLQLAGNVLIEGNTAKSSGGGIYATTGSEMSIADDNVISENQALHGGGICTTRCSSVTVSNSHITGNRVPGAGGGVFVQDGSLEIDNVTLDGNHASTGAGAYVVAAGSAIPAVNNFIAAFNLTPLSMVTITGAATGGGSISNNRATGEGGGLNCTADTTAGYLLDVKVSSVSIGQNKSNDGAGAYIRGARNIAITGNCSFFQNTATGSGGGLLVKEPASLSVTDNTQGFVKNEAASGAGIDFVNCPIEASTLTNNTFDANKLTGAGTANDALFDGCTFKPATLALTTIEQANRPGGAAQPSFNKK